MGSTSSLPAISRHECMESMGLPTSTVGMPVRAALLGPMVDPQARSLRVTKCWGAVPSSAQSEMWVAGYLTAYNQFVHKDKDVTDPYDGAFVLQWIDDYCRKRPNNQLYLAARELLALLRRRQ